MDDFNRCPAPYTVSDPVWNQDETMLQPVDTGLDTPPVDTTVIPQDNTMVADGAVTFPFFDEADLSAFTRYLRRYALATPLVYDGTTGAYVVVSYIQFGNTETMASRLIWFICCCALYIRLHGTSQS